MLADWRTFTLGILAAVFALGAALGFGAGWWVRSPAPPDPALGHAAVVVRAARATRDTAVAAVTPAAAVDQEATARADTLRGQVVVLDASTLQLQQTPAAAPQVTKVPPLVVARILSLEAAVAAKDVRIGALEELVGADSVVIQALEKENALLKDRRPPRCGAKCGAMIGTVVGLMLRSAVGLSR